MFLRTVVTKYHPQRREFDLRRACFVWGPGPRSSVLGGPCDGQKRQSPDVLVPAPFTR
jgi:hypothetical protein